MNKPYRQNVRSFPFEKPCVLMIMLLFAVPCPAEDFQITNPVMDVLVDGTSGAVGRIIELKSGRVIARGIADAYRKENLEETVLADEADDRVLAVVRPSENHLLLTCENPSLPGLQILKEYFFDEHLQSLVKEISFTSSAEAGFFIVHYTRAKLNPDYRREGFYSRMWKFSGVFKKAEDVTEDFTFKDSGYRVIFLNPERGSGIAHFRYKINGRVVLPRGGTHSWEKTAAYTPDGWRFASFSEHLEEGETVSVQIRFELFDGDILAHLVRLRHLPEMEQLLEITVPRWVKDLDVYRYGTAPPGQPKRDPYMKLFREHGLNSVELNHGQIMPEYGEWWSEGIVDTTLKGKINRKLDLDTIYEQVRELRGKWPDHKFGHYTIHWWVPEGGRLIREYPNSVIIGKDGQPVPAGSPEKPLRSSWGNGMICYWRELGHPPTYDFMVGMMRDWVKNFEVDFLYFDGWPAGNYMWNWRLNHVTQPYTWVDYYFAIRRAIQAVSPECAIFLNADIRPMMDINFWERASWHGGKDSKEWRLIPAGLIHAKANASPDSLIIPLQWARNYGGKQVIHDPIYTNYLIGFGMLPSLGPLTYEQVTQRIPIYRAAKEHRGSVVVDAKIDPAWWRYYEQIETEAYALRKGNFGLIPCMNRTASARTQVVSFDTAPLGVSREFPLYLWSQGVVLPPADATAPYESCLRVRTLKKYDQFPERAEVEVELPPGKPHLPEPGEMQLVVAASVPAWVHAADGTPYQSALPEQEGIEISPAPAKDQELQLRVFSEKESATIFVAETFLPAGVGREVLLDYDPVETRPATRDDVPGMLVDVPQGLHIVTIQ